MKSFYEIVLEEAKLRKKYLDNYMFYAKMIKEKAKELLNDDRSLCFWLRSDLLPTLEG